MTKNVAGAAEKTAATGTAEKPEQKFPVAGLELVRRCVAALEEKKAVETEVFFLGEKSPVTNFCVIATGTSDPHLRALRIALEKAIEDFDPEQRVRVQNEPNSGWCVVDAFDVVVHIFSAAQRANYALEELWSVGERVEL